MGRCSCSSSVAGIARRSTTCSPATVSRVGVAAHERGRADDYEWATAGALLHSRGVRAAQVRPARALGHRPARRAAADPRDPWRRDRDHPLSHAQTRRPVVHRAGLQPGAGGDERQREVPRPQPRVPRHARRARRLPHPHPAPRGGNGKIERVWHTLDTEWAHGRLWERGWSAVGRGRPEASNSAAAWARPCRGGFFDQRGSRGRRDRCRRDAHWAPRHGGRGFWKQADLQAPRSRRGSSRRRAPVEAVGTTIEAIAWVEISDYAERSIAQDRRDDGSPAGA
jgi:hypothetical protein